MGLPFFLEVSKEKEKDPRVRLKVKPWTPFTNAWQNSMHFDARWLSSIAVTIVDVWPTFWNLNTL